jgi:hypothetical protein
MIRGHYSGGDRHFLVGVPFFEHHFTSSGAGMSDQTLSGLSLSHFSAGYPRRKVIENLTVPHLPRGKSPRCWGQTAAVNQR